MKKLTFLMAFVAVHFALAQTHTTGDILFKTGYTARIDMTAQDVTLTTTTPDNVWFAIGFGLQTMGSGDVFMSDGTTIKDATNTGFSMPATDSQEDWTIVSNTASGGVRTMVVTRPLQTTDNTDYVFNPQDTSIQLIWALGTSTTYAKHTSANRGATVAGITLSNDKFYAHEFKISPNPVNDVFELVLPKKLGEAQVTVFNLLGKKVYEAPVYKTNSVITTSNWNNGVYLVKIDTENGNSITKKLIKK